MQSGVRHRLGVEPHLSLASSLAYQLIGALKARVIPPLERMDGVETFLHVDGGANTLCPGFDSDARKSVDPQDMCEHCRDMCYHLPLEVIANRWKSGCVDEVVLCEAIAARDGKRTKELLCDPNGWCVVYMWEVVHQDLWDSVTVRRIRDLARSQELKEELKKRVRPGAGGDYGEHVYFMPRSSISFIDRMIAVGWNPDLLVGRTWFLRDELVPKVTFDALVSRGFPISESDCFVFDETAEPAVWNYCRRYY